MKTNFIFKFRSKFMASGKHIGKVLVKIREEEKTSDGRSMVLPPPPHTVLAVPHFNMTRDKVCVITGGLGGFGLQLANWCVSRGARRLVLCSRTGDISQGYKALCVLRWRKAGVQVQISTEDITARSGVEKMLRQAEELGSVTAIFHLAVVLSDGLVENQTVESFDQVWKVKMAATSHLDLVSRSLCPALEHFVLFSSAAAGRGNPGQCNYAMASSAAERVVESRRAAGYPGVAIQWGPIADVGLARDLKFSHLGATGGIQHQSVKSCLAAMDPLMTYAKGGIVSSLVIVKQNSAAVDGSKDAMLHILCNLLGIEDLTKLSPTTPLSELGMDSLLQVEIRLAIERYRGVSLTSKEMQQLTVGRVLEIIGENSDVPPMVTEEANPNDKHEAQVRNEEMLDILQIMAAELTMPENTLVRLDSSGYGTPPLFMIHPIDGSCSNMRGLAKFIKHQVYGLQFTAQAPQTTLRDLAEFYIKHVRSVQPTGPYVFVGYSFGAMVATEMAYLLDQQGQKAGLFILDGLPQYKHLFTDLTRADLESKLLARLAKQRLSSARDIQHVQQYLPVMTWEGRIDFAVEQGIVTEAERAAVTAWIWRCRVMTEHKIPAGRPKLKTGTLIFGARSGTIMKYRGAETYGFAPIVAGQNEVVDVEGDHLTLLLGEKRQSTIADFINMAAAMRIINDNMRIVNGQPSATALSREFA